VKAGRAKTGAMGMRGRLKHAFVSSWKRELAGAVTLAALALAATSCSSSSNLTPGRLQSSLGRTFANLYVLQQSEMGNPPATAASLKPATTCQKGGSLDNPQEGSGVWLCQITYLVAGPGYPVIAKYNVDLQTDGCYAADGDGPASVNGSPTITGPGYRQLVNPLSLIDGCFDTT
jgi:ABC-2 type transport system permease protein